MDKVVVHSVRLKAAIVSRDEREHGERRKLNLGHTFGHAVEKCSREMIHGEAVAVGMAIAARLAVKLGLLARPRATASCGCLRRWASRPNRRCRPNGCSRP